MILVYHVANFIFRNW